MKKIMASIVCAFLFVGALIASAEVDVKSLENNSREDMKSYLNGLDASGWVEVLNSVVEEGSEKLIKTTVLAAEEVINEISDKSVADDIASAINENVESIVVKRAFNNKYILYFTNYDLDDIKVKLTSETVSKGAARN